MSTLDPAICVALDVPTLPEAIKVVNELREIVPLFKIGLELFCAEGPDAVRAIRDTGGHIFLDLKINDIPRTAAATVREAAKLDISYLTIHGFGGREMVRASAEAAAEGSVQLLVVSVLTSLDDDSLHDIGVKATTREQALRIARISAEENAGGLVLSPRELEVIRSALPHLVLCTPGVRPAGSSVDDHRRAMTPAEAIDAGADFVVVGRPILQAADRARAASEIVEQIREAEARREGRRSHEAATASAVEAEDAEYMEDGA